MNVCWSYFDGLSQGTPALGGTCGILYLYDFHWIKFVVGIWERTTANITDLYALKILLVFSIMKGVQKLRIFVDSKFVIDWNRQRIPHRIIYIKPLYDDIGDMYDHIQDVSYEHIYRKRNHMEDGLLKNVLKLGLGTYN